MVATANQQDNSLPLRPDQAIASFWRQLHAVFRAQLLATMPGGGIEAVDYWDYDWQDIPPDFRKHIIVYVSANQEAFRGFIMCCQQIARDRLAP